MVQEKLLAAAKEGARRYNQVQLELLRRFSQIDCGTGDEEGNKRVVELVAAFLEEGGIPWEQIHYPGVGSHVVARLTPKEPDGKILINCHLDTVFHLGDAEKHPFRQEGDWVWGLGVADCKGGFVTSAAAVRIMKEAGMLPNKEIVMIYSCDEETGSHTGREVFKKEAEGAQYAFVFEPARNQNGIITRRKGQAFVTVRVEGVEAHAALNYKKGASATLELAEKILQMEQMGDEAKGIHYNVGRMGGAATSLVVAGEAWCEAAVSLDSPDSLEQVRRDMAALEGDVKTPGCKVRTSIDLLFPTQEQTAENVALCSLVQKAGALMDLNLPEESSAGPSDACWFSTYGVATVDALGPFMKDIHTTNERMYLPSLAERTQLFCLVLGML